MKVEAFFFPNGNVAVCENGEQVPKLQGSWFLKYIMFLKKKGVDVENSKFYLPGGGVGKVFKTSEGKYNWEIKD